MSTVTISRKFTITIPEHARAGLEPGAKLEVFVDEGRIQLVRVRAPQELRGFLEGIDTRVPREH